MGSQSSSGMSGRGSGNNPDQSEPEPNQNSNQTGRTQAERQSGSEEDVDLAQVLAYLLRRGQVRLVHGSGATGLQLVQSYSDSDEDSDGAWDGRLGHRYDPPVDAQPDTQEVDRISCPIMWYTKTPTNRKFFVESTAMRETCSCLHAKKTVKARDVGWSILDVCFTPDARCVLYSSWSDYSKAEPVHVCSVDGDNETHTALDLNANDGCLYIDAHEDDVNAVAFADSSSQLLFSGSDDALCKVWDRRTLREDRPQPVGHLAGHRDGITFIHSKGDARYLISNSKDQTIKLWDVRKFSPKEGLAASRLAVTQQNWDYRWQQVPQRALKRHRLTGDTSVMTYRGHGVLHTLIRCRFSPEFSTGQKFIYTGCSTGKIVIYDVLTGRIVSKLSNHDACVRDWDGAIRLWEHAQNHLLDKDRERMNVDTVDMTTKRY
ncbi:DDB1- and CUL4-associated factor 11 [Labeo rohita]|uniref:DDB1- and CUL4-associated factor 11 n=1 Tax=Labeo rohita TaxID=84645 RepID=A0ABQ8LEE8_LABRO|nr:DDB1- and CUL4-associated factor 11 [Labeo rohita]